MSSVRVFISKQSGAVMRPCRRVSNNTGTQLKPDAQTMNSHSVSPRPLGAGPVAVGTRKVTKVVLPWCALLVMYRPTCNFSLTLVRKCHISGCTPFQRPWATSDFQYDQSDFSIADIM